MPLPLRGSSRPEAFRIQMLITDEPPPMCGSGSSLFVLLDSIENLFGGVAEAARPSGCVLGSAVSQEQPDWDANESELL